MSAPVWPTRKMKDGPVGQSGKRRPKVRRQSGPRGTSLSLIACLLRSGRARPVERAALTRLRELLGRSIRREERPQTPCTCATSWRRNVKRKAAQFIAGENRAIKKRPCNGMAAMCGTLQGREMRPCNGMAAMCGTLQDRLIDPATGWRRCGTLQGRGSDFKIQRATANER